ncbi:Proteasome subunit alpha type-2 [Entomortierella beljakovae]|nr:Proteasome subunit alpha type-2 [Entomortierella beljakovae]
MGAGSGSASTSAATHRAQAGSRIVDADVEMTSASQSANGASTSSSKTSVTHTVYPKSIVSFVRPTIATYSTHLDPIKKGIQYITESTVEYEEFHGDATHKKAGLVDPSHISTLSGKKTGSRSKAAIASKEEQEAFSQDPQIHDMEDALSSILEIQHQIEIERYALESLLASVGAGHPVPGKNLQDTFDQLLKKETKHHQVLRKQQIRTRATPGGIDPELWDMRKKVWEVHHGVDAPPTSGKSGPGGGDDDDDDDMEIVVTADSGTHSLMCPITTKFLQDPVTSSTCKHSFSKEAIIQLIQTRGNMSCPVHGCNRPIAIDMLQSNKALARKVARQRAIQEEISQQEDAETMHPKAIILVGGPSRGTRFRPLSLNVPKPLFPVAGKPIISHHIAALSKIQDLKEILLIGFFEDSVFSSFLQDAAREYPNLHIRYLREYQSLGTAGGLYHFRDEILRGNPEQVFVLHADVACTFPLIEMRKAHEGHRGLCTILGTKVSRDAANNFGCLVAKPDTNEVLHYVEKPESFISNLISCGVYLFDCAIFDEIRKSLENKKGNVETDIYGREIFQDGNKLRLEQDLLRPLAQARKLFVYETKDFWRQIKTAGSAVPVNGLYLEKMLHTTPEKLAKNIPGGPEIVGAVYIHPTAQIHPKAKLGPNVSIGPNVVVGQGVRIRESIVLDNVEIKQNACILFSIIGWNSKVGCWSRVEGTLPAAHNSTAVTKNGLKIQSITILGKEVSVKDETIIRNCIVLPHKELKQSCQNEIVM